MGPVTVPFLRHKPAAERVADSPDHRARVREPDSPWEGIERHLSESGLTHAHGNRSVSCQPATYPKHRETPAQLAALIAYQA